MPHSKIRFVTACQQLLALAVVLAVLTPAASVVSLDVVREKPGRSAGITVDGVGAQLSAYVRESARASAVPTRAVDPTVREVPLTPAAGATTSARTAARANVAAVRTAPRTSAAGTKAGLVGGSEATGLTSVAEPVVGYGAVGVTWAHGTAIPDGGIDLAVRTRTGDTWSGWMDLEYDADHGPDPGSVEARHARPGTDALLVGDVDDVQVKVDADSALPPDLKLAVVDPGQASRTAEERPALDTDADVAPEPGTTTPGSVETTPGTVETDPGQGTDGSDRIDLRAATYTPRPQIYSRAQWGADERLRDKSSLRYFEVHAGFVHHTVNANDYTRAEVPGIIRSIYAYHTKSRGWSDIGYNFLVDRFGRIWEGRYGGIDRPVVGAHTLNYNDYAFAMSAIGNYDIKQPSAAMVQAYGALFAWKLSLHGVNAASKKQWVGSRNFQAINGHRDAASTACPGRYLYAQIPKIRRLAAAAQKGWAGRELESNLAGSAHPDLVVRRKSDGRGVIIPTGGLTSFRSAGTVLSGLPSGSRPIVSPDLTRDGIADLVLVAKDGTATVRPGTRSGTFGAPLRRVVRAFVGRDLVAAVGDVNGDGRNDFVGRNTKTKRLDVLLGRGNGTFKVRHRTGNLTGFRQLAGTGDVTGDGRADLIGMDSAYRLRVWAGTGRATFRAPTMLSGTWSGFGRITGFGDVTGDGRGDLVLQQKKTGAGYVLPARGNGTFGHWRGPFGSVAGLAGAAQLGGDRTADLVVRSGSSLVKLLNNGTTETRAPVVTNISLTSAAAVFSAGDWDRDGHGDVIARNKDGSLVLYRGNGSGTFSAPARIGTGFQTVKLLAAVGDMTGDGWPDLMGQPQGGAIRIYPGRGAAGFGASYVAHAAIKAGRQVAVGRWNGDGAPDSLFIKDSKVSLYPGNGPGGLTSGKSLGVSLSRYDWVVGVSDVGLKGHADVIVRERATGYLWLLPGTASGFGARRFLAEGMGGYDLAG